MCSEGSGCYVYYVSLLVILCNCVAVLSECIFHISTNLFLICTMRVLKFLIKTLFFCFFLIKPQLPVPNAVHFLIFQHLPK